MVGMSLCQWLNLPTLIRGKNASRLHFFDELWLASFNTCEQKDQLVSTPGTKYYSWAMSIVFSKVKKHLLAS